MYQPVPGLVPTPAPTPGPGLTPTPGSGNPQSVIYPSGTQPVIGGTSQYPGSGYALPPGVIASSIRSESGLVFQKYLEYCVIGILAIWF